MNCDDKTKNYRMSIVQAYSNGKTIEFRLLNYGPSTQWNLMAAPIFDFVSYEYRIKKPDLVPFTYEDALYFLGFYIKKKDDESKCPSIYTITGVREECITFHIFSITYAELLKDYVFVAGLPCGKKAL